MQITDGAIYTDETLTTPRRALSREQLVFIEDAMKEFLYEIGLMDNPELIWEGVNAGLFEIRVAKRNNVASGYFIKKKNNAVGGLTI